MEEIRNVHNVTGLGPQGDVPTRRSKVPFPDVSERQAGRTPPRAAPSPNPPATPRADASAPAPRTEPTPGDAEYRGIDIWV